MFPELPTDYQTRLESVLASPASGTMSAWFQARHGSAVTTVQVDKRNGSVWAPIGRVVDARSRKTSVSLNGSSRDYRGMRVEHATDTELVVSDDWHRIAYFAENEG